MFRLGPTDFTFLFFETYVKHLQIALNQKNYPTYGLKGQLFQGASKAKILLFIFLKLDGRRYLLYEHLGLGLLFKPPKHYKLNLKMRESDLISSIGKFISSTYI